MEMNKNLKELHLIKYELFQSQNPEIGRFDIVFEIEGKLFYAHKLMLTLVSDTFNSMLSDRWMKNKDESIKIQEYSYNDFYQFIIFLYSGQCQLTKSNIFTMLDISEFYGVQIFKEYCDEYLAAMTITDENILPLMDLVDKYSIVQLKSSAHRFITNNFQSFVHSDGFYKLNKSTVDEIISAIKDTIEPEELFKAVFKWCEKQAIDKKSEDPNLNLNDSIKADISDFLPCIRFYEMDLNFLHEFIVPKGFIFSSAIELNKILCEQKLGIKIKITNILGETLHGRLIPDKKFIENIKSLKLSTCFRSYNLFCWWFKKFECPSTPSPLKKIYNIEWYLIYLESGAIALKHRSRFLTDNYLLAELTPGTTGFQTTDGCKIEFE